MQLFSALHAGIWSVLIQQQDTLLCTQLLQCTRVSMQLSLVSEESSECPATILYTQTVPGFLMKILSHALQGGCTGSLLKKLILKNTYTENQTNKHKQTEQHTTISSLVSCMKMNNFSFLINLIIFNELCTNCSVAFNMIM